MAEVVDPRFPQIHAQWEELRDLMSEKLNSLSHQMELPGRLEDQKEMLRLIYHHGSIETNLLYLEPSRYGDMDRAIERLDSITTDINTHLAEVRRFL